MPIYTEISRLHHCVTIVARGAIAPDEVMGAAQQLFEAQVPQFAKIVDVTGATSDIGPEQIQRIALLLAGGPTVKRGPVAFLIDPSRGEFARTFASTQGDRPVQLFKSLHQARTWLGGLEEAERRTRTPWESSPWSDPEREAVMFRRGQRRGVPIRTQRPDSVAA
jgi:hypothetical protein